MSIHSIPDDGTGFAEPTVEDGTCHMWQVPEDVLKEILSFARVVIPRFSSVCKQWLDIIKEMTKKVSVDIKVYEDLVITTNVHTINGVPYGWSDWYIAESKSVIELLEMTALPQNRHRIKRRRTFYGIDYTRTVSSNHPDISVVTFPRANSAMSIYYHPGVITASGVGIRGRILKPEIDTRKLYVHTDYWHREYTDEHPYEVVIEHGVLSYVRFYSSSGKMVIINNGGNGLEIWYSRSEYRQINLNLMSEEIMALLTGMMRNASGYRDCDVIASLIDDCVQPLKAIVG